jgi:hypothetical protein
MINVHVEIGSIARIEAQAAKAFADGEPESANPFRAGSSSARIWGMFYDSCKRESIRSGAPKASREGA